MKHILVIADIEDNNQLAFNKALRLAKLSVADIHVVTFRYEPLCDVQLDYSHGQNQINLKDLVIEKAEREWEDYISAQTLPVQVTHEVVWEKYLNQWILNHCTDSKYDLIVKTGHRSENFFYTPTDWQLFREAPVPVYAVVESAADVNPVVLVALDIMTDKQEKQALNARLLEAGFQLSVQMNAELHCCVAIEIPTLVKDMDMIDVNARVHELERAIKKRFKEQFDEFAVAKKNLHIKEGKSSQVINQFARKLKAECIVVGSMGRKGIAGKIIGNTAEKVIHSASTDLLVI